MSDLRNPPMMECGCAANARNGDKPVCAIHGSTVVTDKPSLEGRTASCYCHKTQASDWGLAFFQYRGPGSPDARDKCAVCGFHEVAHRPINPHTGRERNPRQAHDFVPHGPYEHDSFYCGCGGWD